MTKDEIEEMKMAIRETIKEIQTPVWLVSNHAFCFHCYCKQIGWAYVCCKCGQVMPPPQIQYTCFSGVHQMR